jgi:hypothetical protein
MPSRQLFWYSDSIEFYNSADLQLPDAGSAIEESLGLKTEDSQQFIYNWHRFFLVPTPVSISVSTEPSKAIVCYSFSLKNPIFIAVMIAIAAVIVGVNNFKTATYIIAFAAVALGAVIASIQNSFIRKSIADAICLPTFEGEAQVYHNQMVWMGDKDVCPACGATRTTDSTEICQNCGIKLPPTNRTNARNDKFTSQKKQR